MRPWSRRVLLGLLIGVGALAAATWWGLRNLSWDLDDLDRAHTVATADFLATLGAPACLTRDAIIAEADARSWTWKDEGTFGWCHEPGGLQDWLRVTVEPPLFMSTEDENAVFFGFDANGCSVDWSYSSC